MAKLVCNFLSYSLQRATDITVVLPSTTCPEAMELPGQLPATHVLPAKFPVVYLLHGFANNHAQWTGYTNVELYAEERQIAIVNVSAENKSYVKCGPDDFDRFIDEELPEFVENYFPVSAKPEERYIAGLSMGGYGAFLHGLRHPERYRAIGGFSAGVDVDLAAFGIDPATTPVGTDPSYNLHVLAKQVAEEGKAFPKIYDACGTEDPFFKANELYAKELMDLGADVTWKAVPGFGHEWRFWDQQVEQFLDWIPRDDEYAKLGKRSC